MKFALYTLLTLYTVGFFGVLWLEATAGPVTLGLATLRATVWPYYIATGKPAGYREPWELDNP